MAQIEKKGFIKGLVGNLVFRNLDGQQIIQSKPKKVRQSKATKESANEFRQCSSWSKYLRMALKSFLMEQTDNYMYRRLNGAFYNALQQNTSVMKGYRTPINTDMSALAGFNFNSHSFFKDYFSPEIVANVENQNQIKISIPDFEPKSQVVFPQNTHQCELLVYVYATNFENNIALSDAFFKLSIDSQNPLQDATLWISPELPQGYFVLVTAKLMFYTTTKFTEKIYLNTKFLNPSTIVATFVL